MQTAVVLNQLVSGKVRQLNSLHSGKYDNDANIFPSCSCEGRNEMKSPQILFQFTSQI